VTRAVVARAPTRLDLGGGWTDVPPYPEREGGVVCSVAIARYATAFSALD
jgi:D-glycero-alpha-D-manno-heptose-7-phosphate kinase